MKPSGAKKATEGKVKAGIAKQHGETVGIDTSDSNKKKLVTILTGMGALILCLLLIIVVVLIIRNNSRNNEDDTGDEEVTYISPIYESYDQLSEGFSKALAEMDSSATTDDILNLFQTYLDRATDETVRAMLLVDYYMIMMSGDLNGAKKTEIIDGLIKADEIVKNVKSAAAVALAGEQYGDQELKTKYRALADERVSGEDGGVAE